jgi:putative flippase GtrA
MPIRDARAGRAARHALGLSARARIDDRWKVLLNIITSLYERWRHLVHELAKFGIVGAVNTVLDFGLANLLYLGFGWPSLGAKTSSVAVAATSSFFMNRHWTFRHRARTGLRREYTLFFLLNGVGLLIANACILVVERGFGKTGALWFNLAQVAGLALGMVFRFTTYRRFVFVSHERAAARALAEGSVAELDGGTVQPAGSRTGASS